MIKSKTAGTLLLLLCLCCAFATVAGVRSLGVTCGAVCRSYSAPQGSGSPYTGTNNHRWAGPISSSNDTSINLFQQSNRSNARCSDKKKLLWPRVSYHPPHIGFRSFLVCWCSTSTAHMQACISGSFAAYSCLVRQKHSSQSLNDD